MAFRFGMTVDLGITYMPGSMACEWRKNLSWIVSTSKQAVSIHVWLHFVSHDLDFENIYMAWPACYFFSSIVCSCVYSRIIYAIRIIKGRLLAFIWLFYLFIDSGHISQFWSLFCHTLVSWLQNKEKWVNHATVQQCN